MDTVYVDGTTLLTADSMNDLNRLHYTILSDPANIAAMRTTLHAAPGPIGSTTPDTGAFTTISASGAITPSQTAGVVGTTTNNNANAGSIGEYVEGFSSSAAMTSTVYMNAASISLTAGDWDVSAIAFFVPAAATNVTYLEASISTTSANPAVNKRVAQSFVASVPGALDKSIVIPPVRLSLTSTTTVYLVQRANFTVSTMTSGGSAEGGIFARRVR